MKKKKKKNYNKFKTDFEQISKKNKNPQKQHAPVKTQAFWRFCIAFSSRRWYFVWIFLCNNIITGYFFVFFVSLLSLCSFLFEIHLHCKLQNVLNICPKSAKSTLIYIIYIKLKTYVSRHVQTLSICHQSVWQNHATVHANMAEP